MSEYSTKYLEDKLSKELNASYVEAVDESDGCGAKFSVVIVSEQFKNKSLLQRHRLTNKILEEELKQIHAFSQKCMHLEEWEKKKQEH